MSGSSLNPNSEVVRTAVFGAQVRDFLQSDIGNYLIDRAKADMERATEKLVAEAHSMSSQQIVATQGEIYRARSFADWLGQAYQDGLSALELIETGEAE